MKKIFLSCFIACFAAIASAQKTYFLYVQTDDQSPFYVRMADKIYSSSTAGYLILPNLNDSTYQMGIGFPKSTAPETRFAITINQNDKGYLLKNFPDGLTLFDLEELSVVKSITANKDKTLYETKTDKFSSVLSKAADDPGLLKVPVAKKEEPRGEPERKEVAVKNEDSRPEQQDAIAAKTEEKKAAEDKPKDTAFTKHAETTEAKVEAIKTEASPVAKAEEKPAVPKDEPSAGVRFMSYKPSTVMRRSESSTTEGFGIVYFDKMENQTDTVRILIPSSRFTIESDTQSFKVSEGGKKPELTISTQETSKSEALTNQVDAGAQAKTAEKPITGEDAKSKSNSPCKELATDKDFMKLRKNMAAKSGDEDMVFEAKKAFKFRCFTSEQIRYLSTLFLTPAAKYRFFDTAYGSTADKEKFADLQSEIKDDYYLKRFKALVGE